MYLLLSDIRICDPKKNRVSGAHHLSKFEYNQTTYFAVEMNFTTWTV